MGSEPDDLICQWCKRTVAIATSPGQWTTVATAVKYQEKYYCDGDSGRCWENLKALAAYVGNRES